MEYKSIEEFQISRAKSVEQQPMIIPGVYDGLWSAYYIQIIFSNGNKSEKIKVDQGVRGINCSCKITVDKDGWCYPE